MITNRTDINQVLAEMRAIKTQSQAPHTGATQGSNSLSGVTSGLDIPSKPGNLKPVATDNNASEFGQLFNRAIDNVNDLQKTSKQLATAYEQGQSGVDIVDVMVASQKASVSFQAMVQVRNKLVEAYRDVMNMPV